MELLRFSRKTATPAGGRASVNGIVLGGMLTSMGPRHIMVSVVKSKPRHQSCHCLTVSIKEDKT